MAKVYNYRKMFVPLFPRLASANLVYDADLPTHTLPDIASLGGYEM